jgi:DNA-binding NarL/FixJ family response regulator
MAINILLVDDQPSVREGLRMRLTLEPDLAVVGEAQDGGEAVAFARRQAPDVVVMDVEMPGMDGITATRHLRELAPRAGVVMLSIHADAETQAAARAVGAVAFVEKHGPVERLLAAVRTAAGTRRDLAEL